MKLRFALLAFTLLLMASLAGAAPPAQASTPGAPAGGDLPFMIPAETSSPGCAAAALPSLNPEPSERAIICGTCSQTGCQGANINAICGYSNGVWLHCQPAGGTFCAPAAWNCSCIAGPIP